MQGDAPLPVLPENTPTDAAWSTSPNEVDEAPSPADGTVPAGKKETCPKSLINAMGTVFGIPAFYIVCAALVLVFLVAGGLLTSLHLKRKGALKDASKSSKVEGLKEESSVLKGLTETGSPQEKPKGPVDQVAAIEVPKEETTNPPSSPSKAKVTEPITTLPITKSLPSEQVSKEEAIINSGNDSEKEDVKPADDSGNKDVKPPPTIIPAPGDATKGQNILSPQPSPIVVHAKEDSPKGDTVPPDVLHPKSKDPSESVLPNKLTTTPSGESVTKSPSKKVTHTDSAGRQSAPEAAANTDPAPKPNSPIILNALQPASQWSLVAKDDPDAIDEETSNGDSDEVTIKFGNGRALASSMPSSPASSPCGTGSFTPFPIFSVQEENMEGIVNHEDHTDTHSEHEPVDPSRHSTPVAQRVPYLHTPTAHPVQYSKQNSTRSPRSQQPRLMPKRVMMGDWQTWR